MTTQNVLVSDTKSGLGMAISVTVPNSHFSPTAAVSGGYVAICKKRLVKRLETANGARKSVWVDSMRASSPTRKSPAEDQTKTSWIVRKLIFVAKYYYLFFVIETCLLILFCFCEKRYVTHLL